VEALAVRSASGVLPASAPVLTNTCQRPLTTALSVNVALAASSGRMVLVAVTAPAKSYRYVDQAPGGMATVRGNGYLRRSTAPASRAWRWSSRTE